MFYRNLKQGMVVRNHVNSIQTGRYSGVKDYFRIFTPPQFIGYEGLPRLRRLKQSYLRVPNIP